MMSLLIFLCILGLISGGLIGTALIVVDPHPVAILFIAIAVASVVGLTVISNTDIKRQIDANNVKETIGVVTDVSGSKIKMGEKEYSKIEQYPFSPEQLRIGDTVKVKFLDADFGNYIVKIIPLEVKEKQ